MINDVPVGVQKQRAARFGHLTIAWPIAAVAMGTAILRNRNHMADYSWSLRQVPSYRLHASRYIHARGAQVTMHRVGGQPS